MTQIPTWWLVLSAIYFVFNILFFACAAYAVLKLIPIANDMSRRLSELTVKLEKISQRVEELAKNVGESFGGLSQKAGSIMGSIELVAQSASRQFERFSPFIVGAMTAMRLVKALHEVKHGKTPAEATKKKALEKRPATKKKKFLGLF